MQSWVLFLKETSDINTTAVTLTLKKRYKEPLTTENGKMEFADYLKIEQVKELYSRIKFILVTTFAICVLTVVFIWDGFSSTHLIIWLIGSTLIIVARARSSIAYKPENITAKNHDAWLKKYTFFSFITGLNWGLVSVFFFSSDFPTYALYINIVYAGYVTITIASSALYFPAFLAFSIPATLLFTLMNLVQGRGQGQAIYTAIGLTFIFYYIVVVYFGTKSRDLFKQSRSLLYENEKLLNEITIQKETAENAVDAKNQFLAAASHDLRQPLHALGLFIDALQPHIKTPESNLILDKITQSKQAINGLLHSLLDISRLDAEVVENNPTNCSLSTLLKPIEEEYRLTAEAKNLQFNINIDQTHITFVDPFLVERVLRNIIDNAIKYTSEGSIHVTSKSVDTNIEISIKDTGMGIPQQQQVTVFEEFKQLNNPERDRRKGLGLGLSIVKRLCALMNIELQLISDHNQGTEIKLLIAQGNSADIESPISTKVSLFKNLNVIVIDDEKDILDGMQVILSNWGCNALLALNGDEAITLLHQSEQIPDLIIADFRLRDNESGIVVIERIREEYNEKINALLITGDTAPDRLQLSQTADVVVLHKPIASEELGKQMQTLISKETDKGS